MENRIALPPATRKSHRLNSNPTTMSPYRN